MKKGKEGTTSSLHQHRRFKIDLSGFYKKKKVRTYTALVLTIGTINFFLFFAIRPTIVTVTGLINEIDNNKEASLGLDKKIEALNLAQIEYQRVQKDLFLIDEALPLKPDVGRLTRQLEALAKRDQVELASVQIGRLTLLGENLDGLSSQQNLRPAKAQGSELEFSLVANGSYEKLRTFSKNLTGLRRIIRISSMSLSQQKDGQLSLALAAWAVYLE